MVDGTTKFFSHLKKFVFTLLLLFQCETAELVYKHSSKEFLQIYLIILCYQKILIQLYLSPTKTLQTPLFKV